MVCAEAAPDVRTLDAYVVARLRGEDGERLTGFDDVPLGELLTICERLGKASLDEGTSIHKVRRRHGVGRLHAEGFRILAGLPGTLEELLDRLRTGEARRPGGESLSTAYGAPYRFIRELPDHALGVALRRTMFEHASRSFPLMVRKRSKDGIPNLDTITLTQAADAVRMPHARFRDLLDQLGVPYRARERGLSTGYRTEITIAAFEALRPRLEGFLTLPPVARELGVSAVDVADLVGAGLLDHLASGQGMLNWVFPANAAGKLVAALRERADPLGGGDRNFLPLPKAAETCGASVAEVVALVLDGGVAVRVGGAEPQDIATFLVDPRALADRLVLGSETGPTLGKAARDLGLNQSSLAAAITAGLLETRREGGLVRVPRTEIEAFREAWSTMPELRRAMGTATYPPVAVALSAAGIAPAARGHRQYDAIYPREAAMRACIAAASRQAPPAEPGRRHGAVARDLRIPIGMVRQLIENGLIAMQDGCRFGSITAAEVARFRAAYDSTSELVEAFKIRWPRAAVGRLAQAGVRPVCCPPAFHHHIYPRPEAVRAMRSAARAAAPVRAESLSAPAEEVPTLSLGEVATKLDTRPDMVGRLIRKGLLTPVHAMRPGRPTFVAVPEAERFARTYVFANELGRLAGREKRHGVARTVTSMPLKNGVRPVCATPEFSRFLFMRSDAETMIRQVSPAHRSSKSD